MEPLPTTPGLFVRRPGGPRGDQKTRRYTKHIEKLEARIRELERMVAGVDALTEEQTLQ